MIRKINGVKKIKEKDAKSGILRLRVKKVKNVCLRLENLYDVKKIEGKDKKVGF